MAMKESDAQIKKDLLDTLEWDIRFNSPDIDIDVRDGHVILTGNVVSLQDKALAHRIAERIKGVCDVTDELKVTPGMSRRDEDITNDIEEALRRDVWVNEKRIRIITNRGVAHLSGTIDTFAERDAAVDDAWRTPGVQDVVDNLIVAPTVTRSDADIAADVHSDLVRNIRLDPSAITVDVSGGMVFLHGSVASYAQKWIADDVAWWTPGVKDVINELIIEERGSSQDLPE